MLMNSTMIVNESIAKKVLSVVDEGLTCGLGRPKPGQSVEAAVCFAYGLKHSDNPPCVNNEVRALKIELNDKSTWGNKANRAKGMRKLAIAQLGSASKLNKKIFRKSLYKRYRQYLIKHCLQSVIASLNEQDVFIPDGLYYNNISYKKVLTKLKNLSKIIKNKHVRMLIDMLTINAFAHYNKTMFPSHMTNIRILGDMCNIMVEALKDAGSPGCQYLYLCQ